MSFIKYHLDCTDVNSAELEMTVNMLIQIDKLVQLLESPVFTCKANTETVSRRADLLYETYGFNYWNLRNILISTNVFMVFLCCFHNPRPLQH